MPLTSDCNATSRKYLQCRLGRLYSICYAWMQFRLIAANKEKVTTCKIIATIVSYNEIIYADIINLQN